MNRPSEESLSPRSLLALLLLHMLALQAKRRSTLSKIEEIILPDAPASAAVCHRLSLHLARQQAATASEVQKLIELLQKSPPSEPSQPAEGFSE